MLTIRNFLKIIDYHTAVILVLTLISVSLCRRFGYIFDMPTNLIGIAIVFPLVFTISAAYRQREDALNYFASIKGHVTALYYAHRDWPEADPDHEARGRELAQRLLTAVAHYFSVSSEARLAVLPEVYAVFDAYSHSHEALRRGGVTADEISRANQYLRNLIIDFERMNNIARYQPPVAVRAYSRLFINLFPIAFGPYFASIAYPVHPFAGYIVALLYSFVLVSLDNVEDHLENPFDGVGPDDLQLDIAEAHIQLMTLPAPRTLGAAYE